MMDIKLTATVGRDGKRQLPNLVEDQGKVTFLLNSIETRYGGCLDIQQINGVTVVRRASFVTPIKGFCKDDLHAAIVNFQRYNVGLIRYIDGNISPTGPTLRLMNQLANPALGVDIEKPEVDFFASYHVIIFDISPGIKMKARVIFDPNRSTSSKAAQTLEYLYEGIGLGSIGTVPNFKANPINVSGKHTEKAFEGPASMKLFHLGAVPSGGACELSVLLVFANGFRQQRSITGLRFGTGGLLLAVGASSGTMKFVASGNTIVRPDLR